jgi:hypothetical protein
MARICESCNDESNKFLDMRDDISIWLIKVMQAEHDKTRSERTHEEKSKLYQEYEQQRVTLQRSLKRSISKSK